MKTLEEQLWDYIDGRLSESERTLLSVEIDQNPNINAQYKELLGLHELMNKVDLDEPSMSFSRNIMDSISLQPAPVVLKTKTNKAVIYGIFSFFILSISTLIIASIQEINFDFSMLKLNLNLNTNFNGLTNPIVLYTFLFIDLVLGLLFFDYLLRKRFKQ